MSTPRHRQRHPRPDTYRTRYTPHSGRSDPGDLLTSLLANELFQQLAPLLFVLAVPLFVLLTNKHRRTLLYPIRLLLRYVAMVLQTLSGALPWNWYAGSREKKAPEKKKLVRTRAEQLGDVNGSSGQGSSKDTLDDQKHDIELEDTSEDGYYPGIVNISGTYCFMDSTLQALASLTYLQPYIDAIHTRAEEYDVPTPVVDALRDILHDLNTPRPSRTSLRPHALIQALSAPPPSSGPGARSSNRLFSSREHQDAQELFQVLIEAVKAEAAEIAREAGRDLGLGGALASAPKQPSHAVVNGSAAPHRDPDLEAMNITKSVFDGLTANRRTCVDCGYTEAVMHFSFDNWQLALPRASSCDLADCLADYTRLEVLTDCICRRCSMEATYQKYAKEGAVEKPTTPSTSPIVTSPVQDATNSATHAMTKSKKKRIQETRKLAGRVKALIDEGRVEEDVKGVQIVKVTRASTKQAMVARPPPVLVLHLNRSLHFGGAYGAAKNTCRVAFPELLDLTPYTTSGSLNTSAQSPLSGPALRALLAHPPAARPEPPRTLYRLAAAVVHYGQHAFGHYVCYRRRPRPARLAPAQRWAPPRAADGAGVAHLASPRGTGRGWLRVSDDDVRECGIESVLQEGAGAFMLYYERVAPPAAPAPAAPASTAPAALANGTAHLPVPAQAEDRAAPAPEPAPEADVQARKGEEAAAAGEPAGDAGEAHEAGPAGEAAGELKRHRVYLDDDERTPRCSEETLKPANGYGRAHGSLVSLAATLVGEEGDTGVKEKCVAAAPPKGPLEPRLVRSVSLGPRVRDGAKPAEGGALNGSAVLGDGGHLPDAS
ncbi:cysteine proteinase [Phanerochaete sordida]|uniref:ubiquitinyl hydrolase 1 n=1 Tax=Phanerochaete sordida TaxID=48140 RepID=A0A9P3G4E4_9APHY|nr:cysteine proteinase [Phanerochaete sordida]